MERATKIIVIARAVHEAIRAYQAALGEEEAPPFSEAGWMRDGTVEAVEFALRNPTPGAQHEAWVASRLREGWVHGPKKSAADKTHPSLVPFDHLSLDEQRKDTILIAVVQSLSKALEVPSAAR